MRWPRALRKSSNESGSDTSRRSSKKEAAQEPPNDDIPSKPATDQTPNNPGLSRIFCDAALYERVLNACPVTLRNASLFRAEDQNVPSCIGGFNDLIGCDLGGTELAVTGRLAKLSVNTWASPTDDPFGVGSGSEVSSEEEQGEQSSSDDSEEEKQSPPSAQPTLQEESASEPKLAPEEIVDLLEQEFGALAPPGEEKLLLETDAAFFKDVVVLVRPSLLHIQRWLTFSCHVQGVVHLTTHRFTFHASLLSSEPGYTQSIIRSGSALVHSKGWHRKRKVWLQLEHDMISSFPSSRDEDKIKPLRSILCQYLNSATAILLLILFFSVLGQGNQARRLAATPKYRYRLRVQRGHRRNNCRV